VTQFCRKLAAERPLKDIRDEYNYPKKKGIKDECSRLLEASTMKSRRGFAIQRLMNAMRQAHADGWFIVFDTLTLADHRLEAFYDILPKKLFRIRMSRNFGMKMLTMTNLSTECLIQLTKLGYDATPFNQILKQNAKREMRLRLGKV